MKILPNSLDNSVENVAVIMSHIMESDIFGNK